MIRAGLALFALCLGGSLCLTGPLCLSGCPLTDELGLVELKGKILIDPAITSQYTAKSVMIHTFDGTLLDETDIEKSDIVNEQYNTYYWTMDQTVDIPESTQIIFYVKFYNNKDVTDMTAYYSEGQSDIINAGQEYDWSVSTLYVPIFDEDGLRSIGVTSGGDKNYILIRSIQLTEPWEPLCTSIAPFSGIFNGRGHTISNLNFKNSDVEYIGFFSYVEGDSASNKAQIQDLTIEFAVSELDLSSAASSLGIVAAHAENTLFDTVLVRSDVGVLKINKDSGNSLSVGGIAGELSGTSSLQRCTSYAPLSITSVVPVSAGILAGASSNDLEVFQCYAPPDAMINIDISGNQTLSGNICTGGLVGEASGALDFEQCYAVNNIIVHNANPQYKVYACGILGDGSGATSASFKYSVAWMKEITAYTSGAAELHRISLVNSFFEDHLFAASDLLPSAYGGVEGDDRARSDITSKWFSDTTNNGGLAWNFNDVWVWSAARGILVFQWE